MLAVAVLGFFLLADVKTPTGRAENASVLVDASVYADKASIQRLLGSDLDGFYVVVEVKLTPRGPEPFPIQRDDFLLRTDKNGERSTPFVPSQIAGRGALVVSQTGGGGGIMQEDAGPIWGGAPGTGSRPRRLGGDGGGAFGNGGGGGGESRATTMSGSKEKENPLKAVLEEKMLPEKKTAEPVTGLLYFPIEAKQKIKDLELIYTTPKGKLSVRFR
jgi:hypothetical protein